MCGIAGYLSRSDRASSDVVESQLALLAHRGPDSSGVFARGRGAVGQNRLAIIDLVTGDPPITAAGGTIGVALNGEIYNYRSLRRELAAEGHRFTTKGDTEVIAHLAEGSEPRELAERVHGMFAFVVWDSVAERLVLGRDRLGKKPLYYWFGSDVLVFGSEIKAVLAHPAVPRRLDPGAIPAYLGFGYVPSPRTFFEGVCSVPPGHVLVVEADWGIRLRPYWSAPVPGLDGSATLPLSLADAATEVRSRLRSAVCRRLVSDVPLGAFLSGGVDSSAVVALMAEESDRPVRTFTIGFEDQEGYDERAYARSVSERCGTDHTEFVVAPSAVDLIDRLVWHHDQPFGDSSAIPTFLLSELTRSEVTVALCGDGGDELFAGYERFNAGRAVAEYTRLPSPLRHLANCAISGSAGRVRGHQGAKLRRFAAAADLGMPDAFRSWISYVPDHLVARLTGEGAAWAIEDYRRIWADSAGARPLDRLLNLNLRTYLLDDLLPKVDRMSMAHGLEVRAPFLDHELVEFALLLAPGTKVRGLSLKRCLKAAMADDLPREILERPKRGFAVPLDRWFREDLAGYLAATLSGRDARLGAHLDPGVVRSMVAAHQTGRIDHGHALWALLTLEVFLRQQDW